MPKKVPQAFYESSSEGGRSNFHILCENLGIVTSAGQTFLRYTLENACLMDGKQQDYGSKNISSFGTYGVVVRMSDKFERIKNLFKSKRRRAVNESIVDSFTDIANYAIIAQMCEKREWPDE